MARHAIPTLVALACGALLPAAAVTQEAPREGSPSGTVYEIPAEQGRDEAAPRAPRNTAGGDAEGQTPIRTENGLGTSSQVPGAPAAESAPGGGDASGAAAHEVSRPPVDLPRTRTAAASAPSPRRAILLAALAVVVGLALGLGARTAVRAHR